MNIRREPTYLSTEVFRACWLLAQSQGRTADEMADTLLRELIAEKYPQISQAQKQIHKLEAELVTELGGGK